MNGSKGIENGKKANDEPPLWCFNDGYVYFHNIISSYRGYILMPRPVLKFLARLRMWYADFRGHHGMRWDYEPSEHYFGRKKKWVNL